MMAKFDLFKNCPRIRTEWGFIEREKMKKIGGYSYYIKITRVQGKKLIGHSEEDVIAVLEEIQPCLDNLTRSLVTIRKEKLVVANLSKILIEEINNTRVNKMIFTKKTGIKKNSDVLNATCFRCGKEFHIYPSYRKRRKDVYCKECWKECRVEVLRKSAEAGRRSMRGAK
jgi:hypothetical protein